MSNVVVIATFQGKPGSAQALEAGLQDAIQHTHAEQGCLTYALHQHLESPDTLVLIENWTSREALDAHAGQPWVAGLASLGELLTGPPQVDLFTPKPAGDASKGRL